MNEKAVEALADYICWERSGMPLEKVRSGFAAFYVMKAKEYLKVAEQACKEEEEE